MLALLSFFALVGTSSNAEPEEFSDAARLEAETLVEKLNGDAFAEREAAAKELQQLPISALPWLELQIEGAEATDIELRARLKSVVRSLKKRGAMSQLRHGTRVEIDLKNTKPEEVLEALEESVGASLSGIQARQIWEGQDAKDFSFEGSYWDAVEAMLTEFPPKREAREDLGQDYRVGRWLGSDFSAAANPSATAGILRVRHARISLENTGGKDFLVLNLVPSIEPGFQAESLVLHLDGLKFDDGATLEPEEKICAWKPGHNGGRYHPGSTFVWIFALEKGVKLGGAVRIEGHVDVKVRKLDWTSVKIPEDLNESVKMSSSVELKILEREEGRLKIQFEGTGSEPLCFDDYELRKEAYEVLDKDGAKLEFNVNSTSSGGGKGWRNSFAGRLDGEPASVRARLPGGVQEVQLDFKVEQIPLPGSSLVD